MTLRKIVSKAVAGTTGAYVGQRGEIFYNSDHGALSISDGVTVGGNPIHIHAESVIYDHNIIPSEDNTFTIGSPEYRWQSIHIGPGTIFVTDQTLGTDAGLTVDNGVLQINGANQLQVGQLKFVDNTIESTTPDIDIEIGITASTANLVLNRNTVMATGKTFNLGSNANVIITGGSNGQSLTTDGAGNLSWTTVSAVAPTYGQFYSTVTQTVPVVNTEYKFNFNSTDFSNNVVLGPGGNPSRIIINKIGIYNIQFSAQVDKAASGATTASAYIWFKKNGTAIPHSTGFITLDQNLQVVQSWNILVNVTTPGDYYEIAYAANSTVFSFPVIPANGVVGSPASPSIIVTVTPVGA
jgi:hypothetical protein